MATQTITKIQVEGNDVVSFLNGTDYVRSMSQILPQSPTYISYQYDTITISQVGGDSFPFTIYSITNVGGNSFPAYNFQTPAADVQSKTVEIYKLLATSIFKGCCECGNTEPECSIQYTYGDDPAVAGSFKYSGGIISFNYITGNNQDFTGFFPIIQDGSWVFIFSKTDPTVYAVIQLSNFTDATTHAQFDAIELNGNGLPFVAGTQFCLDFTSVGGSLVQGWQDTLNINSTLNQDNTIDGGGYDLLFDNNNSFIANSPYGSIETNSSGTSLNSGSQQVAVTSSYVDIITPGHGTASAGWALTLDGSGHVEYTPVGTGTVESVDLSMPSAFTVSNNPVTTSGTLTVTGAGTSSDYIDGTGALQTFPTIPSPQGLQDVITEDPVLTTNNTVQVGANNFAILGQSGNINAALELTPGNATFGAGTLIPVPFSSTGAQVKFDGLKGYLEGSDFNTGNYVAVRVDGGNNQLQLVTPNVNLSSATNGQVLTLVNQATGAVEFTTVSSTPSPLTTKGDLYTYSTTDDRLPVGADGQSLFADSTTATGLTWQNLTGVNGLSNSGPYSFKLGGTLIEDTTIDGDNNTYSVAFDDLFKLTGFTSNYTELVSSVSGGTNGPWQTFNSWTGQTTWDINSVGVTGPIPASWITVGTTITGPAGGNVISCVVTAFDPVTGDVTTDVGLDYSNVSPAPFTIDLSFTTLGTTAKLVLDSVGNDLLVPGFSLTALDNSLSASNRVGIESLYNITSGSQKLSIRTEDYSTASTGDVLTLQADGTVEYQTPSTGSGIKYGTASGTNTYTVTISGVTGYTDGDTYVIKFTSGNDDDSTININGYGAKLLTKEFNVQLTGGDIVSGQELIIIYDGTNFQTLGVAPNQLFAYVTNDDSVTINKGEPVYAYSSAGNRMSVKLASNTQDSTSAQTVGVVFSTSIAAGQKGFIITQGVISGLDTSAYSAGAQLYLGATAGTLTSTKPYAPNHLVYIGIVERSNAGNGQIYIKPQNGYELDELHDVDLNSVGNTPSNNDVLTYITGTNNLWKPRSITTILGYTPVTNARTISTTSPLSGGGDLTADRTLSIADAVADGATKGAAAFTASDFNSSSGVISLDYTNGQKASALQPGFLSASDFSLLNRDTFTIRMNWATYSLADATTYYFAESAASLTSSATLYLYKFPFDCKLVGASIYSMNGTNNASAESSTVYFRLNNTTDVLLSNAVSFGGTAPVSNITTVTGLSQSITAGNTANLKIVTANWATNPTGASLFVLLYFERT